MEFEQTIESIKLEINKLKYTKNKRAPYFVEDIPSNFTYIQNCCKNSRTSLHNGQRKLFNCLLYFIAKYANDDDLILYAGSAPGWNISAVADLCPTVKFHLYDKKPTKAYSSNNNIKIFHDPIYKEQGLLLTDDEIIKNGYKNMSDNLLLFSDIRSTDSRQIRTEQNVNQDLDLQKKWILDIKPRAFCLKFRIPYTDAKHVVNERKEYFDGFGLIQPFAGQTTTEIRLLNTYKQVIDSNGKVITKNWELSEHQNRMFFVNTVLREWATYENKCTILKDVDGGDYCYDCSVEEMIFESFLNSKFGTYAQKVIQKSQGTTPLIKLRNWVSEYSPFLTINRKVEKPGQDKFQMMQKELNKPPIIFEESPLVVYHGTLPLLNRNVDKFLEISDPFKIIAEIIKKSNISLSEDDIICILKDPDNIKIVFRAITHKSITSDPEKNYEYDEIGGDRVLGLCIIKYIIKTLDIKDPAIIASLISAFSSGLFAVENFCTKLKIPDLLIISEQEDDKIKKAQEDCFEAVLGLIDKIFDKYYKVNMIGVSMCFNIVSSILNTVDFRGLERSIYPPKTMLKELFDEKQWPFEKCYVIKRSSGDESDANEHTNDRWTVKILSNFKDNIEAKKNLDSILQNFSLEYTEKESKALVERNACVAFLEFFKNRGVITKPQKKFLEFKRI